MKTDNGIYDKLMAVAHTLRKLHDGTKTSYHKQDVFAIFTIYWTSSGWT